MGWDYRIRQGLDLFQYNKQKKKKHLHKLVFSPLLKRSFTKIMCTNIRSIFCFCYQIKPNKIVPNSIYTKTSGIQLL